MYNFSSIIMLHILILHEKKNIVVYLAKNFINLNNNIVK